MVHDPEAEHRDENDQYVAVLLKPADDDFSEYMSRMHNKTMHTTNGNRIIAIIDNPPYNVAFNVPVNTTLIGIAGIFTDVSVITALSVAINLAQDITISLLHNGVAIATSAPTPTLGPSQFYSISLRATVGNLIIAPGDTLGLVVNSAVTPDAGTYSTGSTTLVFSDTASSTTDVRLVGIDLTDQNLPIWMSSNSQFNTLLPLEARHNGADEARAARHNQMMHANNGNTEVESRSMMGRMAAQALARARNTQPPRKLENPEDLKKKMDAFKAQQAEQNAKAFATMGISIMATEEPPKQVVKPPVACDLTKTVKPPRIVEITEKPKHLDANYIEKFVIDRINANKVLSYEGRLCVLMYPSFECDAQVPQYHETITEKQDSRDEPTKPKVGVTTTKTDPGVMRAANKKRDEEAIFDQQKWNQGVTRVADTLKKQPMTIVDWYMTHPESKNFRMQVLEQVWGKTWTSNVNFSSTQWVIYCKLNNVSRELCLLRILELFPEWTQATKNNDVGNPWYHITGQKWTDTTTVLEVEQATHNQKVHAENGNIDGYAAYLQAVNNQQTHSANGNTTNAMCHTQSDVDSRSPMGAFYGSGAFNAAIPYLKGSELALRLATEPSSTNATQLNNPANSILRADTISSTNVVVNDVGLNLPSTVLIPRQVRNGVAAGLINTLQRLTTKTLGPTNFKINPLTDTALSATIVDAAIKANQNLGRADNTNLNGFNAIDLAWLARIASVIGLSMDQCLVKLLLLHKTLSWGAPVNTLPLAQVGIIDQNTQIDPAGQIALGYNDVVTNAFDEDCGGATSVLPFYAGETGEVGFHLTTETIPINERANALFIPATILMQDEDADSGLALIIFLMMWCPYPTGIWSVYVDTLDSGGGNPDAQTFVPTSSLVQVPGQTTLHIILPRRTTAANPSNQATANNLAILQPRAGPTASTGLAANQLLNVNFVNGGLQMYNLAELIYTWAQSIDVTQLSNFIQRLSYTTGIGPSIERCQDLVEHTTEWFPMMTMNNIATQTVYAANSNAQFAGSNVACISYEPTTINWPQTGGNRADYLVNATEIVAWNKIATQLATSTEGVLETWIMPEWLGNVNALMWNQYRGMAFAILWNSHYQNVGWSAAVWNSAYSNNTQSEFRRQVRGYYNTVSLQTREPFNSTYGPMLADYFAAITGRRPGTNPNGGVKVTIFDYMCPPTGNRTVVLNNAGLTQEGIIPVNLPDIWQQLLTSKLPKWQSSLPLPSGPDSLRGYFQGLKALAVPGSTLRGGLIDMNYYRQTLDGNETADYSDEMRWNERVMYLTAGATPRHLNAAVVADTLLADNFVKQRPIVEAFFMPQMASGLQRCNTMAAPTVDENGQLIFAIAAAGNSQLTRQALYRKTQLAVASWQIDGLTAWNDELTQSDTTSKSMFTKWGKNDMSGKASSSSTEPSLGGEDSSIVS